MPGGERVAAIVRAARRRGRRARPRRARPSSSPPARRSRPHVVAADPQERTGLRAVAQLRPHARATRSRPPAATTLLHGEAVAVGLVFAGAARGRARADRRRHGVDRHRRRSSASLGLPDRGAAPASRRPTSCWRSCAATRRRRGGLTFVLPGAARHSRRSTTRPGAALQARVRRRRRGEAEERHGDDPAAVRTRT